MRYSFSVNGIRKGFYELNKFPGNAQIVVSNTTFVESEFRDNGAGKGLMREKNAHAKELGYDYMLATVVASNECMIKLAEKAGYKELDRFINRVTGNETILFGMHLKETENKL